MDSSFSILLLIAFQRCNTEKRYKWFLGFLVISLLYFFYFSRFLLEVVRYIADFILLIYDLGLKG